MASAPDSSASQPANSSETSMATKIRNLLIVSVAVVLSVLVVLGVQTQTPAASLETLAAEATPLEVALTNNKPSFVEFYANWCTSCQAMAGDMADLRTAYGDQVNFVMLNVDNTKWLPEMLHYRVDGIPHFLYLDPSGEPVTTAIGEQPKAIIASNLDALVSGGELPYQSGVGQLSELDQTAPIEAASRDRGDDPRSHGAQAVN
ncbi:thioredoxin family protein [Oscillatoria sp. CS-180]|uniref:thioredoxin family protein n=1 Tax=Oscillatoria sp. CS-180 TaxID=3021720 RepID=UPI00232D9A8A|nr:thioredoxin family protein [Oscillatoria sp. CS-180]MDB9525520.1 thioredoxin family protein [Oscillatoria sp. CS-180]